MAELVVNTKNKKEEKIVKAFLDSLEIEYITEDQNEASFVNALPKRNTPKPVIAPTFYFIVITKELKVYTYHHEIPKKHLKGIYYIHCSFSRFSETRKHTFYKYQVYDDHKNIVKNNTIEIDGIRCVLEDEDYWGNPDGSTNFLIQQARIYDVKNVEKKVWWENQKHTSQPICEFIQYIIYLKLFKTHEYIEQNNKWINPLIAK